MIPDKVTPQIQKWGVTHRFATFNHDKTELRITASLFKELLKFIEGRGYHLKRVKIIDEPEIVPYPVTYKLKPWVQLRDNQVDWAEYLGQPGHIKLNNAATGVGKGLLGIWTAVGMGCRVVIMGNARFLPIWRTECGNFMELEPGDFMDTDVGGLDSFIDELKKGTINPKIVMISLSKVDVLLKKSRIDPLHPNLDDLFKVFRPGLRIYDEVHESFHQVYLSLMYGNIAKTIGNSATMKAEDPFINKMYEAMFPLDIRLKETVYSAHMHIKAFQYRINMKRWKIRFVTRGVYNDITFESSVMDNKMLRPQYIDMMLHLFEEYYYKRRVKETKCLFFFTRVETCKIMIEALKKKYPDLDAISFTGEQGGKKETKDEYRKHEVVFSTPGSCGTGKDIPGLITCISFHNVKSVQRNYQMRGRVRENKNPLHQGIELLYGYTVCMDVPKHRDYDKYRRSLFEGSCISYQNVNTGTYMY